MITTQTVFILGAGASCPYGLPTAAVLQDDILASFRKNYGSHLASLKGSGYEAYPQMPVVEAFLKQLDGSNTESTDLFLSRHPQFETVGKLAISFSILRKEGESRRRDKTKTRDKDWYRYLYNEKLARELTNKDAYQRFGDNKVTFITFNYDRSLEYLLFESLLNSFEGADAQKVAAQIERTPVIHIYGRLAPLPWQEDDASKALDYGADDPTSFQKLISMTSNLYVVHEERASPEVARVHEAISRADRIFFLGFHYAEENRKALGFPYVLSPEHTIYGTALDRTEKEVAEIKTVFVHGLRQSTKNPRDRPIDASARVEIRNCDSLALLRRFL